MGVKVVVMLTSSECSSGALGGDVEHMAIIRIVG
jgi:hypothetical protein